MSDNVPTKPIDVDVWVRGSNDAETEPLPGVPPDASTWTDPDVRTLLTEMLLAIERHKNPGGDPPSVTLKGFSWIVSPDPNGVLVHLEMKIGTASAGPFNVEEARLTAMIARVLSTPASASTTVH